MANPDFPQNREETLLNALAGSPYDVPAPVPQSRVEKWLAFLAENGIPGNVKIGADVATVADLPTEGKVGEMHYVTAEKRFYVWRGESGWTAISTYADVAEYAAYAEQLDSTVALTVSSPFVFRPSGGGADVEGYLGSKATIAAVYGNTLVWNQLVDADTTEVTLKSNHVYLTRIDGTDALVSGSGTSVSVTGGTDNVFDLTQMFGAGSEPSTTDEFRAFFPLLYYAYDAGRLLNFTGTGIKTVGFNALAPDGTAHLLGGQEYEIVGTYTALSYSTGDTITPVDGIFTPSADGVLTVTGADAETCVHLTWSGYRNGETAAYKAETKTLPISTYFPDGMKSAGTARDELRKDKAIKRIAYADLSSLRWTYFSSLNVFYATLTGGKPLPTNTNDANVTMTAYPNGGRVAASYVPDGTWQYGGTYFGTDVLTIKDTSFGGNITNFKNSLSGKQVFYELKSIINTPIDPPLDMTFTSTDFGTEMLLPENGAAPVTSPMRADIGYTQNLRDKLQRLPMSPNAPGDYIVHYDGVNQFYQPYIESGSSAWGDITGDIDDQTDLSEKLAKLQKIPDEGVIADGTVESIENDQYDAKYMHKQTSAVTGNLAKFDSAGQAVDSDIPSNMLMFGGDEEIITKILSGVQKIPLVEEA